MSFKSWFERKLGIHIADEVEEVDLGDVSLERINEFARDEGSVVFDGDFLTTDGRSVFEAKSGQQFLVNDDGSMVAMSIHAGERVIIVEGGQQSWQALPDDFDVLREETAQLMVGFKEVYPGFVCLINDNIVRFDRIDIEGSQKFLPGMMDLLLEEAQSAIKEGLFVFCFLTVGNDDSVRFQTPLFPVD